MIELQLVVMSHFHQLSQLLLLMVKQLQQLAVEGIVTNSFWTIPSVAYNLGIQ